MFASEFHSFFCAREEHARWTEKHICLYSFFAAAFSWDIPTIVLHLIPYYFSFNICFTVGKLIINGEKRTLIRSQEEEEEGEGRDHDFTSSYKTILFSFWILVLHLFTAHISLCKSMHVLLLLLGQI